VGAQHLNRIAKFFHELFTPHCIECRDVAQDERVCLSCETLRQQLEIVNYEKRELLNKLIREPEAPIQPDFSQMKPRMIPWNVRRQELEAEDRKRAQLIREKEKELGINELEKEIGVS